jgi:hypothetical protein
VIEPIRLPRLSAMAGIADSEGRPTPLFMRYFNDVLARVETAFGGIIDALNQAEAAQQSADTAQGSADQAQLTADGKLSKTDADGYYVAQDDTPPWGTPAGPIARDAFTTYTAPVLSTPPTQAELQALADALGQASQHFGALVTDLIGADVVDG